MYWFLLKKALPFTLTFILGAALSAVTGLFGTSEKKTETFFGSRSCDYSKRSRMRRHLVAERSRSPSSSSPTRVGQG